MCKKEVQAWKGILQPAHYKLQVGLSSNYKSQDNLKNYYQIKNMYMNVFACMHVCLCTICVFGAQGDQKKALDPYRWCVLP